MKYLSATVKPYSAVKTKADLKSKVADINAGAPSTDVDVTINDFFGPLDGVTAGLSDLLKADAGATAYADLKGVALTVGNATRSWGATVTVKGGRLVVA